MTKRVLVTGGSGFIGTNLIERLVKLGYYVVNVDIKPPKNTKYLTNYYFLDITDQVALCEFICDLKPQYLIHLAARTDLLGKTREDYKVNIGGVENICIAASQCPSLKRILFASSMLVCRAGYIPRDGYDYSATTAYGHSKVDGENIVRRYEKKLPSNIIFRPTSIWGPWFDVPYKTFFDIVLSRRYFKIGAKSCTKTYGYIENAVNQIISLLISEDDFDDKNLNYIGDRIPVNVDDWAALISSVAGLHKPYSVPFPLIVLGGLFGDLLTLLGVTFPLTSFRVKNMTTDNILSEFTVVNSFQSEEIEIKEGVKKTLKWLKISAD
tara:strand:- start:48 stop:1019 length:972 start_codon:yes stop_codon:yes gene_type:complete